MQDEKPIIDADFEVVSGQSGMTDADVQKLKAELQAKGIGPRELRKLFTESGHPDFQPGGRQYRPPSIWQRLPWLKYVPAVIILVVFVGNLIWDEGPSYWLVRWTCQSGMIQCPADAPALLPR